MKKYSLYRTTYSFQDRKSVIYYGYMSEEAQGTNGSRSISTAIASLNFTITGNEVLRRFNYSSFDPLDDDPAMHIELMHEFDTIEELQLTYPEYFV